MKNISILILIFSIATSCNDDSKMKDLENRILNIENKNKILSDSLHNVTTKFVTPFQLYEKIVLSELKTPPNKIIANYEALIKNYPDSFWQHEAKKRVENIKNRKEYWSEKDGWKLPSKKTPKIKIPKVIIPPPLYEPDPTINCPGC
ncbi:hypothetical protein [Cellulophaga fucicola]|uniref:Lipoprotein n=1 Tax=Cellulophaga fucicola TaxID=76595 RepID=A0A1K1MWC7_9FLAO|nr:hypothetical protein [Cellulophaga fucicola]SFW26286.1 hypothetical protein SAMN05660313_00882 [Cellulophaga fucicola]